VGCVVLVLGVFDETGPVGVAAGAGASEYARQAAAAAPEAGAPDVTCPQPAVERDAVAGPVRGDDAGWRAVAPDEHEFSARFDTIHAAKFSGTSAGRAINDSSAACGRDGSGACQHAASAAILNSCYRAQTGAH
jgi:hypothetical protein